MSVVAGGHAEDPQVLVVGDGVPRVLVRAAGARPVAVRGEGWAEGSTAPEVGMLGAVDPAAEVAFETLRTPIPAGVVGIAIANDSQSSLRIFYALRMLRMRGELTVPVHLVDAPTTDAPATRAFVRTQYEALWRFVRGAMGEVSGGAQAALGDSEASEALVRAASEEALLGAALDELRARRTAAGPVVRGSDALDAYRAAATLEPRQAITDITGAVAMDHPPTRRIFVTGSDHPDGDAYRVLESSGAVVVGEDHRTGDGGWLGGDDAVDPRDPLASLVAEHLERTPAAPTATIAERASETMRRVRAAGADGVIALIRRHDEAPLWDLVDQRRLLEAAGIPFAVRADLTAETWRDAALSALHELTREDRA